MYAPTVTVVEPGAGGCVCNHAYLWRFASIRSPASALRRVKVSGQIVLEREGHIMRWDGRNGFRFILGNKL